MKKVYFPRKSILIGFILFCSSGLVMGQVIISQYYEGVSYDKWIEITNIGSSTVNLASPQLYLALYSNPGASDLTGVTPYRNLALTGSMSPGQVLLFKHSSAALPIYATGTNSTVINFSGNDIVVISTSNITNTWVDRVDVIGNGTTWGTDKSFYRNSNISSANSTYTTSEWTEVTNSAVDNAIINSMEYLGTHLTTTWTGSSGTNWATSGNWSDGIPTANHDVTIPTGLANYPTISATTSANCYNVTIESTATLTIESNASNSGSLIFGGTYTGSATAVTYQRYMSGPQSHMIGSPFTGQTINSGFLSANSIDGMKDYIENPEAWSTDYATTPPNATFSLGKGYAIKLNSNGSINLGGTPNNATVNVTLTRAGYGWNLLSNPFTSAIAANDAGDASNNLIRINSTALDPSYTALYIWDGSNYKILNHASESPADNVGLNYLQVGQGFFVKSKSEGGTFTMTPEMQSHQTGIPFKTNEQSTWASITLIAEISNAKANTVILFGEDMHRGLDVGYDAGLFANNANFSIYSRLVEDNGVDYGLQCLPTDYEDLVVPIGIKAKAGEIVRLSAGAINIPESYVVILEDRATNTIKNLTDANAAYLIQLSDDIDGTGRFFIHTSFKNALGFDDLHKHNVFQVFSRVNSNQIVIYGEANPNTTARIFSITGKQLLEVSLNQSSENLIHFNEENGIYIIQLTKEQGTQSLKFVWFK